MALPSELKSLELESQLLAGVIKNPEEYHSIATFIGDRDFTSKLNKAIYFAIQQLSEKNKDLDVVVIADKINSLGQTFAEEIDISVADYLEGLSLRQVKKESVVDIARSLAIKTFQRQRYIDCVKMANVLRSKSYDDVNEIVAACDEIYHGDKDFWSGKYHEPENIFEDLEEVVEERGNNPVKEFGLMGPHKMINEIYGSLLRPGNISVVVSRSGVGKTQFWNDYAVKVAAQYDIPVLHLDNGEMSKEELQNRMAASLSGVPIYFIETGLFRKNEEMTKRIRAVWPLVKKLKFFYYNVGGKTTEQILSTVQKFYFSKVGRDTLNKMICCFDYIKAGTEKGNKQEYLLVNDFMIKTKNFITTTCPVAVATSVQANRFGITTNKNSYEVNDDESIIGLSDAIQHNASHTMILRRKTLDELGDEEQKFGTHKLIWLKHRHLGERAELALTPIKFPDGSNRTNWINLSIDNFNVKEEGTARDVAKFLEAKLDSEDSHDDDTKL